MSPPHQRNRIVVEIARPFEREAGDYREWVGRLRNLVTSGYTEIVVNVAAVSFADSVLLGAIAYAFTAVRRQGATLKLLNPTPGFRELLHVTRLDQVLKIVEADDDEPTTQAG